MIKMFDERYVVVSKVVAIAAVGGGLKGEGHSSTGNLATRSP